MFHLSFSPAVGVSVLAPEMSINKTELVVLIPLPLSSAQLPSPEERAG